MKIQNYDVVCKGIPNRKRKRDECKSCPLFSMKSIYKPTWRISGIDKCLTEFKNHFLYGTRNSKQNT